MSLPDSETAECYIVWVPYCQSLNVKLSILHKNKISHWFMHLLAASRYCYEISLFIIWSSNKSHLNINACALVLQQRQIIQRAISLLCASLLQFILQFLSEKHPLGASRRKSGLPQVTQSWSTAENSLSTGGRAHSKPL